MAHFQAPLAELGAGDSLAHIVQIHKIALAQGKKGKPYLDITMSDKSGKCYARKWDSSEEECKRYQGIKTAIISGEVKDFNGKPSYVIKTLAQVADEFTEAELDDLLKGDASSAGQENAEENMDATKPSSDVGTWLFKTKAEVGFDELMKTQKPLKDCVVNDNLNHALRLISTVSKDTKGGKPYLELTLGDASSPGFLAKLWGVPVEHLEFFKTVKVLYVTGKVEKYNEKLQIKIEGNQVTVVTDVNEADVSNLIQCSPYPLNTLIRGVGAIVTTMQDQNLKNLCLSLLKDPKNFNFRLVPAGLSYHHSWRSGLIEHTYRLMLLLDDFVKTYNELPFKNNKIVLNRDAILTIALYHDFFKCVEYTVDCGYAPSGNLLKHLSRAVLDIGARTAQIEGFPEKLATLVAHGAAAHHGKKEWDALVTAACPEAYVVHWFDNLCSKLDPTLTELNLLKEGKYSPNRIKPLGSIAYIGGCQNTAPESFVPVTLTENYTNVELEEALGQMIQNIKHPEVRKLCEGLYAEKEQAFASAKMCGLKRECLDKDVYSYGLLEYTYRVMHIIGKFVNSYNEKSWPGNTIQLNNDYLVGGALLQNLYRDQIEDPFLEDISACLMGIGRYAAKNPSLSDDVKELMAHIVATQHGTEDSPEIPICPDSVTNHYFLYLIYHLDYMNITLSKSGGETGSEIPLFGKKINLGASTLKDK